MYLCPINHTQSNNVMNIEISNRTNVTDKQIQSIKSSVSKKAGQFGKIQSISISQIDGGKIVVFYQFKQGNRIVFGRFTK
jgi:hypothetical protein